MSPMWTHYAQAVVFASRVKANPSSKTGSTCKTNPSASRVYDFAKMRSISDDASPDRILIDVREPAELEAGYIPGAVNIPISSQPDALFLPDEEFEDRFGFSKPAKDKEVVFYCKAGVRASAAAQLAEQQGYKNVAEYRGSMLDWNKQGGPLEKP
ncbi:Rhodanese-like protein [Polychaeton citri CBS 116435]|uniref:Rhodanese-like protein n=1 Tax=Polychaeton citri CBS 116435 TaxID=1314669 RepID=A0A9P4QBN0_9PEZI|nr:Rhodanese-like protein [Polychaeton citri CBS 116435]